MCVYGCSLSVPVCGPSVCSVIAIVGVLDPLYHGGSAPDAFGERCVTCQVCECADTVVRMCAWFNGGGGARLHLVPLCNLPPDTCARAHTHTHTQTTHTHIHTPLHQVGGILSRTQTPTHLPLSLSLSHAHTHALLQAGRSQAKHCSSAPHNSQRQRLRRIPPSCLKIV